VSNILARGNKKTAFEAGTGACRAGIGKIFGELMIKERGS
jgi:hypothetical protein